MTEVGDGLPYVDEHAVRIPARRERVWEALQSYVARSLGLRAGHPLATVLGTEPRAGFEVKESSPSENLTLVGRHRFARYLLRFDLADDGDGTLLRASTFAEFPGLHGRLYRTLVIGSRAHAVVVRRILRDVSRASLSALEPG